MDRDWIVAADSLIVELNRQLRAAAYVGRAKGTHSKASKPSEIAELAQLPIALHEGARVTGYSVVHWPDGVASEMGTEAREVEVGRSNDRFIAVLSGLEEGEEVLLEQPLMRDTGLGARPSEMATAEQREGARGASRKAAESYSAREAAGGPEGKGNTIPRGGSEGAQGSEGRRGGFDPSQMAPEQMKQMRERLEEHMKTMSPAERQAMEERIRQFSGSSSFSESN